MNDKIRLSVIIPTFNRERMLGNTIQSFVTQKYPQDQYEIIIADNNSSDNTKNVVEEWQKRSPVDIKYIFEPRQGVHFARNTAAKYAKGEILFFTDDDMVADEELLYQIVKVFQMGHKIGSATGKVLPIWETEPPAWILKYCNNQLLSLIDRPEDLIIADYDVGVFSCHQAIPKNIFFESGGFNPENTAGEWIGDGETGLNIKIKELGYKFAYTNKSVIHHIIPAQRLTQQYLNKRMANGGNSDCYTEYRKHKYSQLTLYLRILKYWIMFSGNYGLFIFKFIMNSESWRLNRAYVSYYYNRIKYDYKLIRDHEWRELVLKRDWLE